MFIERHSLILNGRIFTSPSERLPLAEVDQPYASSDKDIIQKEVGLLYELGFHGTYCVLRRSDV